MHVGGTYITLRQTCIEFDAYMGILRYTCIYTCTLFVKTTVFRHFLAKWKRLRAFKRLQVGET